jgi:hypothetical protein
MRIANGMIAQDGRICRFIDFLCERVQSRCIVGSLYLFCDSALYDFHPFLLVQTSDKCKKSFMGEYIFENSLKDVIGAKYLQQLERVELKIYGVLDYLAVFFLILPYIGGGTEKL